MALKFIKWVYRGPDAPNWVQASAWGGTMGILLALWVLFLKLAPDWALITILLAAPGIWLVCAIRAYRARNSKPEGDSEAPHD
jgi:predicted lysophospholipase L1 biosynthesis ABC-type transport system permease subunit